MPGFVTVDDADDARLAVFRLHERGLSNRPQRRDDAGAGLFMAEGDLVVERAVAAGCEPVAVLVDELRPPPVAALLARTVTVFAGGEAVRAMVTRLGVPTSVVAVFRRPPRPSVEELARGATRLVVAEAVDNPANVGAIVRNAAALGWDGLVLDPTSADPLARRSLRVSMGHALVLPHARAPIGSALAHLDGEGFVVAALTPHESAVDIDDLTGLGDRRLAGVVGAERAGLSDDVLAAATVLVRIPMRGGVDSLNVAAATAIACWALRAR